MPTCSVSDCCSLHYSKGFCRRHYAADYRARNLDKVKRWQRESAQRNPETSKAAQRRFKEAHPGRSSAQGKEYREANRDGVREYHTQYYRDRPAFAAAERARRRASRLGAEGSFSKEEWRALLERFHHLCPDPACECPTAKLTVDHIVPLCLGGSNSISNIQPLCGRCNSRKNRYLTPAFSPRGIADR